ncbi:hypothetical protein [Gloeothece verrucosa]|uniref:Uncharacterized protein n=1 Tax=Gloeothece verrucosa (strain PCC 7822) TaxID=497965 RepID=E0UNT7_GLOV7|nr:hypothetical protein [Gloeothece verrucosa]ADN18617.1 hypothetical protein Cyan7822_6980 [Gloeothece verrucosa PCC 7822]
MSHQTIKLNALNKTLNGREAFDWCISRVYSHNQTIWLKFSHNQFLVGKKDDVNLCPDFWLTSGSGTNRKRTGKIANIYEYLRERSQTLEGGVFYLPGKPGDYPLKEFCQASSDIGAELDWGTHDEQWEQINRFVSLSGLYPDSAINSGGKSVHPHWRGNSDFPMNQWIYLRRLLAIIVLGDPAVCNPHQPMRLAGFLRKEKNKEQVLEYWGDHQYSYDEFIDGFKRAYNKLDLTFPVTITDDWWRTTLRPILTSTLNAPEKYSRLRHVLVDGLDGYEKQLLEEHRQQQQRLQLKQLSKKHYDTTNNLIELVKEAEARLGSDGFNWSGHRWKWSGITRARGCCPWHESKSGTAGWIAPRRGEGGWGYACPSCTDNRQIGAFAYWWYLQHGLNAAYPSGRKWVEAATEFCSYAGITVPETQWGINEQGLPEPVTDSGAAALFRAQKNVAQRQKQSFFEHIAQKVLKVSRHWRKGFGASVVEQKAAAIKDQPPSIIKYTDNMPLPTPNDYQGKAAPRILFETCYKNKITPVYLELKRLGWRGAWDRSYTGSGKSYRITEIAQDVIYLDVNYKNPSIDKIKDQFVIMPTRHDGMLLTLEGRLVRAKTEEEKTSAALKSNCINADLLNTIHQLGYDIEGSGGEGHPPNPICAMCPFWNQRVKVGDKYIPLCRTERGDGYGFLYERMEAMASSAAGTNAAAYPDQLPVPQEPSFDEEGNEIPLDGLDLRKKILAWEEASLLVTGVREISAKLTDYDRAIATIVSLIPELSHLAHQLNPIRELIEGGYKLGVEMAQKLDEKNYVPGQKKSNKYYGLSQGDLLELIGQCPQEILGTDFIEKIESALSFHNILVKPDSVRALENGGKWSSHAEKLWAAAARTAMQREANALSYQNVKNLPSNWLLHFLLIWAKLEPGIFKLEKNGHLTISIPDARHQKLANAAGFNLFLDATGDKKQTCLTLGLDPNTIIEVEEIAPMFDNLTVYNINLPGMKSNNWSNTCTEELQEFLKQTINQYGEDNVGIIGQKCHADSLGYKHWFGKDERGTNHFKGLKVLICLGTPWDNWGSVRDRYWLLNGHLDGLQEYYQAQVKEKFRQTAGRQRVHLQPDREFIIIFVGTEQDLSYLGDTGALVINQDMLEFCPTAAPLRQQQKFKLLTFAKQLMITGQKITQELLAAGLGVTQSCVSKLFKGETLSWKDFQKLFQDVFNDPVGTGIISLNQITDSFLRTWLGLAETYPIEMGREFVAAIKVLGINNFLRELKQEDAATQAGILSLITPLVEGGWEMAQQFLEA